MTLRCSLTLTATIALAACGAPAPGGVALGPDGATTAEDLVVTVDGAAPTEDHRVVWYVNDAIRPELQDQATVPASLTLAGQVWRVGVAELAGGNPGDYGEATLTIANSLPTATVEISPAEPTTVNRLNTNITRQDLDEGSVDVQISWKVDGVDAGINTGSVPPERTSKGEVWEVTVVATDSEGDGPPATASVTILNTPPSVRRATVSPGAPTASEELVCEGVDWVDVDDDLPSYNFEWLRNGAEPVGSASKLPPGTVKRGDVVKCRLTPKDDEVTGSPVVSADVAIANAVPVIDAVTISPDPATKLDALSATIGGAVDLDDDEITFSYKWFVNERPVAITETLDPKFYGRGDKVFVAVTPNDGISNGPVTESDVIVIGNTPPTIVSLRMDKTELFTDTVVKAIATTSDLDRDEVTVKFEWFVDGVSAGTGESLDGNVAFDKGDEVWVTATPDDGDAGVSSTTAKLTVKNTLPTAPEVGLEPAEPDIGEEAVCAILSESTDKDGDSVSYTFAWQRDGSPFTGTSKTYYTGDTLASGTTKDDELYKCTVTPNDGTGDGPTDSVVLSYRTGPFNFSTCGKTGNEGPSQSQCDSTYTETALDSQVVVTKGIQSFTIPESGTYRITAAGAAGKSADPSYKGGKGAKIQGDFSLSSGDELLILVGQEGITNDACSGGGGGGTFVLDESYNALLVAGGGGGTRTSVSQNGCGGLTGNYGGTGSNSSATWGCGAKTSDLKRGGIVSGSSWGSAGGGMDGDGAADSSCSGGVCGGKAPKNGGNGGGSSSATAYGGFGAGGGGNGSCGGGGGGGYSGGDGGRIGGGGGSYNGGSSKVEVANENAAAGYVIIEKL